MHEHCTNCSKKGSKNNDWRSFIPNPNFIRDYQQDRFDHTTPIMFNSTPPAELDLLVIVEYLIL